MVTKVITDNTTGGDYTGTVDAKIKSAAATTNYGTVGDLEVTSYDVGDNARSLLKFDGLSNITGPVTVSSVTLELWLQASDLTYNVDFHKVLVAWTQAGVTWNKYDGTTDWGTAGCSGAGDREASASASISIGTTAGLVSFSSAGMATDVQGWINSPSTNNGWLLKRNTEPQDLKYKTFESEDSVNDGRRPILTVVYTADSATASYPIESTLYF